MDCSYTNAAFSCTFASFCTLQVTPVPCTSERTCVQHPACVSTAQLARYTTCASHLSGTYSQMLYSAARQLGTCCETAQQGAGSGSLHTKKTLHLWTGAPVQAIDRAPGHRNRCGLPAQILCPERPCFPARFVGSASAAQPNTDCVCPAVVDPVCAEGDVTYGNFCEAACAGKAIKYNGQCADPCECTVVLHAPKGYTVLRGCRTAASESRKLLVTGVSNSIRGRCPHDARVAQWRWCLKAPPCPWSAQVRMLQWCVRCSSTR